MLPGTAFFFFFLHGLVFEAVGSMWLVLSSPVS